MGCIALRAAEELDAKATGLVQDLSRALAEIVTEILVGMCGARSAAPDPADQRLWEQAEIVARRHSVPPLLASCDRRRRDPNAAAGTAQRTRRAPAGPR